MVVPDGETVPELLELTPLLVPVGALLLTVLVGLGSDVFINQLQ